MFPGCDEPKVSGAGGSVNKAGGAAHCRAYGSIGFPWLTFNRRRGLCRVP
jgi:hypothetical protein